MTAARTSSSNSATGAGGGLPVVGRPGAWQTAAHPVDNVSPHVAVRQWVQSLPNPLLLLRAAQPKLGRLDRSAYSAQCAGVGAGGPPLKITRATLHLL